MFPDVIETERLRLERLGPDAVDLREYYGVCGDEAEMAAVTRYVPWSTHETIKESADLLERWAEEWEAGEGATYAIRPREGEDGAGAFAGQAGLSPEWDRRLATLGVWLRERFWGRGYSGERAAAMFELAFDRLDLEVVAVYHDVDNERSGRAIGRYMDRFGGRREGVLRHSMPCEDGPRDQVRYTLAREEWAANRPDDLAVEMTGW